MKRIPILVTACLAAGSAAAQTTVSAVVNAASSAVAGLPNSPIAQGSMFVAYGANMGPTTLVQASSYPLPTSAGLSGTSAKITVNGTSVDAIMVYTLASQIAAVAPSNTPLGTGTLTVTYNGSSGSTPITIVANNFGIFTVNQQGSGPGIVTFADYSLAGVTKAANPGETLLIWGSGVGPVSGNEAAGPLPGNLANAPVEVFVGNKSATVTYKGRSGCCTGLDQIAFLVPDGVAGCDVPVVVKTGNYVSNFVSTSIAPSGRGCSDPSGLTSTDYQALFSKTTLNVGSVTLTRSTTQAASIGGFGGGTTKSDDGNAFFDKISVPAGGLLSLVGTINVGACRVLTFTGQNFNIFAGLTVTPLDAGASIGVSGPAGQRTLTKSANAVGGYSAKLGDTSAGNYLDPGTYTVTGPGGADVGSFSASFTLPPALVWTNQDSVSTVNRGSGQLVTWTGGDPNGYVDIGGVSIAGLTSGSAVGVSFNCHVKASDGSFTVPPYVLLSLPASASVSGFAIPGNFSVASAPVPKPFSAPGLDVATLSSNVSFSKSVTYQ